MASRLTFQALSVSDLARSLWFYRDLLGVPLRDESHDADLGDRWCGGAHAAYSWTDGAFLHFALYPTQPPYRSVSTGAQVDFHVVDFEAVDAAVQRASVVVLQAPRDEPWRRTARYRDPDGNIVSVTART